MNAVTMPSKSHPSLVFLKPWAGTSLPVPGRLLLILAFWPVWNWYLKRLTDGSDEPWGLVSLGIAAGYLWRDRDRLQPDRIGLLMAAAAAMAYSVMALLGMPPLLRALLAVTCLWAAFGGRFAPAGVGALLVWSLPVLASARFYLDWPLRISTAAVSCGILNGLGEDITREGTILWTDGAPVTVDAPCSGVHMLWTGLLLCFVLAAARRISWGRLALMMPLAVAAIWAANTIRATILFFPEAGKFHWPEWSHEGVGLVCFILLAVSLTHVITAGPETAEQALPNAPARPGQWILIGFLVLSGSLITDVTRSKPQIPNFSGFPTRWEGEPLTALPLSPAERRFAATFPGRLGAFSTPSGNRIILRWVTSATRKLHSSADCLRSEGYRITGGPNDRLASLKGGGTFQIRERIFAAANPGQEWSEVSPWYWDAFFGRSTGPWWASTVIEPVSP